MQSSSSTDTSRCPLCGQPNQCAIAAGQPAESCWCMQQPVSKEALARLAPEARGKSCICPQCAQITDSKA
jgi:hypothetical protein